MEMYDVIVRPLVTEKSTHQGQTVNAYSFEVHPEAKKPEIRQAVAKIYNVKVVDVRTSNRRGKRRRTGYRYGSTRAWKKAVVVLDPEYHIDLF